jgi:hypothetical protein
MFFVAALCALPCWFFTNDPLWAVVTLTIVDLMGFGPTIRKAYDHPHEESAIFFALSALRNLLVILALQNYSLTTVLFPAAVGFACLLLALLWFIERVTLLRRRKRNRDNSPALSSTNKANFSYDAHH